jgi:hypothetical protein
VSTNLGAIQLRHANMLNEKIIHSMIQKLNYFWIRGSAAAASNNSMSSFKKNGAQSRN